MEAPMTAADVAAVMGNRNQDFMGGGFYSIFALLMLFAFMRGGFWGNGNEGNAVTESALCNSMNFNNLENAVGRLSDNQAAIARQTDNAICNLGYTQQTLANGIEMAVMQGKYETAQQISDCCCTTKQLIAQSNYERALDTCGIKEAIHAEGEATRGLIQANKIEALQQKVTQLENQAALAQATCGMVRMPQGFTYAVPFNGFGGCGCNGNGVYF